MTETAFFIIIYLAIGALVTSVIGIEGEGWLPAVPLWPIFLVLYIIYYLFS